MIRLAMVGVVATFVVVGTACADDLESRQVNAKDTIAHAYVPWGQKGMETQSHFHFEFGPFALCLGCADDPHLYGLLDGEAMDNKVDGVMSNIGHRHHIDHVRNEREHINFVRHAGRRPF